MTEEEMWNAVKNSDANYDGLFFYAVKTTGIFCRPSCKSKLPKRENICYFKSAKEAEKIKEKLNSALNSDRLTVLGNIGITQRRITEIFKNEYGVTPSQYRNKATQSH